MDQQMRYRAFISYSHSDTRVAAWLHRALESYRPPRSVAAGLPADKQRLAPIFLDRDELQTSGDLSAAIQEALSEAEFLVVVCSPAAALSRWVNEEVLRFKRSGRADHVLCVLADGDPGDPESTFPEACLYELTPDGELDRNAPIEPLASDLRPGEDRRRALIQVVATLLGVRFDDLIQREAHRRQRFFAKVALGATFGMLVTLGLAVFAFVQRNESQIQRQIAEREAATATRVTRTLTTLIEDTFTELVRASARENVDGPNQFIRSALANTAQVVSDQLAEESDASAEALNVQAAIEQLLGNLDAAEQTWLNALVSADPDTQAELLLEMQLSLAELYGQRSNPQRGTELIAEAAQIVGTHSVSQDQEVRFLLVRAANESAGGHHDAADERYAEVIRFLEEHREVSDRMRLDAYNQLSVHFNVLKRLDEALKWATRAIELAQSTFSEDTYELIAPHNAAGWAYRSLGDLEKSQSHLEKSLRIARANFGTQHPQVAEAHNAMGGIAYSQLDMVSAIEHFQASLDIAARLYGDTHLNVAGAHSNLATAMLDGGRIQDALAHYTISVETARKLGDPGGRALAVVLRNQARANEYLGRWAEAERLYMEAIDARTRVFGAESQPTLEAMIHLANLLGRRGRAAEAEALFARAMTQMREASGPDDPGVVSWSYTGWRVARANGELEAARRLLENLVVDIGEHRDYAYIGDAGALTELARLCLETDDVECATARWEQAQAGLRMAPDHPDALFHAALGVALARHQGDGPEASRRAGGVYQRIQLLYPDRTDLIDLLEN